jgi:O-antigen ligase
MIFFFYFLIAYNIGLFKFPAGLGQAFADLVNIIFFLFILPAYFRARKGVAKTLPLFKVLEIFWFLFLLYFIVLGVSSHSLSRFGSLGNIRLAYPYFLFWGSFVVLSDKNKIRTFLKALVIFSIIGGIISIIQSLYGIIPLFDIDGFYNIGHWGGNNMYITPWIARVMLPPLYLIYIVFIALLLNRMVLHDHKNDIILIFLIVPILIGFARSQWLAVVLTILITALVVSKKNDFNIKNIVRNIFFALVFIMLIYFIIRNVLPESFILALSVRFLRFFSDIEYGQGTFGSRLFTIGKSISLWLQSPLWGHGPAYAAIINMPELSDVGFTFVLVTIGLVGFLLLMILSLTVVTFGYRIIKLGIQEKNKDLFFSGFISFSIPVFLFLSQTLGVHTFATVLLALGSGYCAAQYKIFLKSKTHVDNK